MNTNEVINILFLIALPIIWFTPGIIIRKIAKKRSEDARANAQKMAISRLYPKDLKRATIPTDKGNEK